MKKLTKGKHYISTDGKTIYVPLFTGYFGVVACDVYKMPPKDTCLGGCHIDYNGETYYCVGCESINAFYIGEEL